MQAMANQYIASDVQLYGGNLKEGGRRGVVLLQVQSMVDAEAIHLGKGREISGAIFELSGEEVTNPGAASDSPAVTNA